MTEPTGGATAEQPMRKTERRQAQIAELVPQRGSMTAQELADAFDVSIMTIYRDVDELAKRGVLRKFRGGVTALPSGSFEARVEYRMAAAAETKQRLAEAALAHVEPGMSLLLDDSTTLLQMIPGLERLAPLHVATNFLAAMQALAAIPDIRTIGIGGDYDPLHDSFQGMAAIEAIQGLHADALFMSTSAVSATALYHQEDRIVAFKRAMIASAESRYLIVDHTKLGKVALHRLASLDDFDLVITDAAADPDLVAAMRDAGAKVEVVA